MSRTDDAPQSQDAEPSGFFAREIVSGGTQSPDAPEHATSEGMLIGGIAWIGGLGFLLWRSPWIFVFVVGVLLSVMLHEFGHYYTARKSGMKVTQFFVGFGPRVWSIHRDGVEYGLRALPLGGFVKIVGMTRMDEVPAEDEGRTYRQATFPRRMWVITAGSVMHIVIALVTIVAVYAISGRVEESGKVTVYTVATDSPASRAGLQANDVVTAVDGRTITTGDQFRTILGDTAPGTTVHLSVLRAGTTHTLTATLIQSPTAAAGVVKGYLGVGSDSQARVQQGVAQALWKGPRDLVTGVGQAVVGIARVINPVNVWGHLVGTNHDLASKPMTVVGAAKLSSTYGKYDGWAGALSLLAAINVSFGVFNMLPLLPFDGGHASVAIYERLRERNGRRYFADIRKMMPVVTVTVALLAFMFLTGLYLDTIKG